MDKTIVFTFSRMTTTVPCVYHLWTRSAFADKEDKRIELNAIDFCFYMKHLSKKYNDKGIGVEFDYED